MTARGLTSPPLYPENRDCLAPSAHGEKCGKYDRGLKARVFR